MFGQSKLEKTLGRVTNFIQELNNGIEAEALDIENLVEEKKKIYIALDAKFANIDSARKMIAILDEK